MSAAKRAEDRETTFWSRLLRPERGDLSPEAARSLLKLDFEDEDRTRMRELATRNRSGALMAAEEAELDSYCRVGKVLDLMHAKARRALRKAGAEIRPRSPAAKREAEILRRLEAEGIITPGGNQHEDFAPYPVTRRGKRASRIDRGTQSDRRG